MLRLLAIRNLAIIDELNVEFAPGLNVLTGETGAGKSILIGALSLVLGGRGAPEMVRSGASRAVVDAAFDVTSSRELAVLAAEMGVDLSDGELLLSRELHDSGKTSARINGRPATIGQLRDLGDWLVDLHGQHEHQSLLSVKRHGDVLDAWGGGDVERVRADVATAWKRLQELQTRLKRAEADTGERLRQADLYRFQINDIASAEVRPGEEQELDEELNRLQNAERLQEGVRTALLRLTGDGDGSSTASSALDALAGAARDLSGAAAIDQTLQQTAEAVRSAQYEVEESARSLTDYLSALDADDGRLDAVQERLARLSDLKRRYGGTLEEVLAYQQKAVAELAELENADADAEECRAELEAVRSQFEHQCSELTALRAAAARSFQKLVGGELRELAMERAEFRVDVGASDPGENGADSVEFLISANPGEPPRPLARIASGGELSRVMLAIKSAAAAQTPLPTMVFDEIDVGIGGRTAEAIGARMHRLSRTAQVICITHLPQIAIFADWQFAIAKSETGGRTVVLLARLDQDERVEELVRMVAGSQITEAARQHVRELLAQRRSDDDAGRSGSSSRLLSSP